MRAPTLELLVAIVPSSLQSGCLHLPHNSHLVARLHQPSRVHLEPESGNGGHQEIVVDVVEDVENLPVKEQARNAKRIRHNGTNVVLQR